MAGKNAHNVVKIRSLKRPKGVNAQSVVMK